MPEANNVQESFLLCPECNTLLNARREMRTFRCQCGLELQHPCYQDPSNIPTIQSSRIELSHPSLDEAENSVSSGSSRVTQVRRSISNVLRRKESNSRQKDTCNLCKSKFTLLKRKKICRNCETEVCQSCSNIRWPSKMLPKKKNLKNERWLRICSHCSDSYSNLRDSLFKGDKETCERIIETNTVELYHRSYIHADKNYPIHCAIDSGNLELVKYLILIQRCSPRVTNGAGVSGLGIACSKGYFEIVKFLLFRGLSGLEEVTDMKALQSILSTAFITIQKQEIALTLAQRTRTAQEDEKFVVPTSQIEEDEHLKLAMQLSEKNSDSIYGKVDLVNIQEDNENKNECAICLESESNCVFVPCGHMSCCFDCAGQFTNCPVCRNEVVQVVKTYTT